MAEDFDTDNRGLVISPDIRRACPAYSHAGLHSTTENHPIADSKHVAAYSYTEGSLGRDSSLVTVRGEWSIFPETIYEYAGPSNWDGTEVGWLTNDHPSLT